MIINMYYFEEEAKLNITTDKAKYSYQDVSLSLYNQIFQLHKRNLEGRIWKLLKNCSFEKIIKEDK